MLCYSVTEVIKLWPVRQTWLMASLHVAPLTYQQIAYNWAGPKVWKIGSNAQQEGRIYF